MFQLFRVLDSTFYFLVLIITAPVSVKVVFACISIVSRDIQCPFLYMSVYASSLEKCETKCFGILKFSCFLLLMRN